MRHRYQRYYCEENVWWLGQEPRFASAPRWVVFISNALRQCPLWHQRAALPGEPVVWDYHVILIVNENGAEVWDLDSRLGVPVKLDTYLEQTFAPVAAEHAPRFRLVAFGDWLAGFTTDRSHMRGPQGDFLQPPPAWPPPQVQGVPMNLLRFVDMDDSIAGRVLGLDELSRALAKA